MVRATGDLKLCWRCNRTLDISAFNKDKHRPDGLDPRCRECGAAAKKVWGATHRQKDSYKKKQAILSAEHRKKNPEKEKARYLAGRAKLRKSECEKCGATGKLHMHHPDYSKPLEVITLCIKCHEEEHHGK